MSKKDKLKAGTVVDDPFGESQPPAAATTLKAGTIVEDPFVEPASFQQAPKPASTPSGAATGPSTPSPSPLEEPLPMFMDLPWASQGQSSASPPSRLASQQEPLPVDGSMGLRLDGAPKGNGYLGPIKAKDGSVMTELSFDFEADGKKVFAPLLVPTLSQSEVDLLASGADPTPAIIRKAEDHALQRIAQGKSPFAGKDDPITGVNKDLLDDDQRARLQKDLDALRRSAAMSKTGFMPAQADAIADKLEKDRLARQPKVEPDYAKQVLDEYGMEVPEGMDPKTYKQGLDSEYKSRFAAMDLATAQRTKQASAERLKRLDASMQALAGRMKQVKDAYAKFPEWSATADPEEARRELSLMENTGKQTQASMEAYQDLARSALRDMQLSVLREYEVKKGTGSWAGAMGLSIPKGVGSVAAGAQSFVIDALAAMLPKDAVVPKGETGTRDEAAKILKRLMLPGTRASYANAVRDLTGIKTTDEYYADQQENGNIVTRSLLGLGESVPGMVTPGMFGIFLQSADAVGKELEGEEYDDISEGEKAAMKTLIAVPQMALERFGFRNLVKNTAVSKGIVARVLRKMAPGASAGQIQRLIDAETRSVIGNAVSRGFGATASEVETGVMQEGVDVGIRSLYNLAKGKRVLDQPDNLYDATVQIAESGVMEGIGGGVLGAPAAIGSAMRTGKVARDMDVRQYEMFEGLLKDPEYASAVSDWNNALVEAKKITEAEKVKRENDLAQASEIAAQIPENLPVEARRDAYDLLVEKRKLKKSDPALSGPRIAEIDAKLAKLSGATKEDTGAEKAKSEDTNGTETKENAPTPPPEQKVEGEVKPTAPATAQVPQGQAPATGTTAVQKDELDDLLGEVPKADGNEQRTTDEEAGGGAAIEGAGTGTGAQVAQATGDAQDAGVPLAQQQGGGGVAEATATGAKEVGAEAPRDERQAIIEDAEVTGSASEDRASGKRTIAGQVYERQAAGKLKYTGEAVRIQFSENVVEPFEYALMEADDVQPSHINQRRNPYHFVPEAQPKSRTDKESQVAAQGIAANPDMNLGGAAPNAYSGAPVVNARGEVIQGNNRSAGYKEHYAQGGTAYKAALAKNASQFGFTAEQVEGMKRPVLVRRLNVNDARAIELGNYDAKDIESGSKQGIDPAAVSPRIPSDVKSRITGMLFGEDGDATMKEALRKSYGDVADALAPYLNPSQRNGLFKKDSKEPSPQGIDQIEQLVRHFLFDGGPQDLAGVFERGIPHHARNGIMGAVPSLFSSPESVPIIREVQNGIMAAAAFRMSGVGAFDSWTAQSDAFGPSPTEVYTPTELAMAKMFDEAKTAKEVRTKLYDYAKGTKATEADMFTEAAPGKTRQRSAEDVFGITSQQQDDQAGSDTGGAEAPTGTVPEAPREGVGAAEEGGKEEVSTSPNEAATKQSDKTAQAQRRASKGAVEQEGGQVESVERSRAGREGRVDTKSSISQGAKDVATRITNAEDRFIEFAMENGELSRDEALAALASYKKNKAIKIDPVGGGFSFTAGGFADRDVLRRAAGITTAPPATTKSQKAAAPKAEKEETTQLDDFGERLEGARKFLPPSLKEELGDDKIASLPLSKIWPADAHESIEDPATAAFVFALRSGIPAKPRTPYKVKRWVQQLQTLRRMARDFNEVDVAKAEHLSKERGLRLDGLFAKARLLSQLPRDTWGRIGDVSENPDSQRRKSDAELKADDIERSGEGEAFGYYHVDPDTGVRRALPYGSDEFVARTTKHAPYSTVNIDGKTHAFEGAGRIGPDQAQQVKELLGGAPVKKGGLTAKDFEIRRHISTGVVFINRKGDAERRRLKEFRGADALKDARAWLKDPTNITTLEGEWEAVKARDNVSKTDTRRGENRERVGENRRNGKDVDEQMFTDAFGFRGVQFGNWVKQGKGDKGRQALLNDAYDALLDLSDILGIPSEAISLNGSLGLALGARGKGKASAHFEADNLVINLTKTRGMGTLAHEWFHALDNYFSRKRGVSEFKGDNTAYRKANYVTYAPEQGWLFKGRGTPYTKQEVRSIIQTGGKFDERKSFTENAEAAGWVPDANHKKGIRPEVERAFAELVDALNASPMAKRARSMDKGVDGYWSRIIERGARSFENYVISKMAQKGWSNDFLANVRDFDEWRERGKNAQRYPYLLPEEEAPVIAAFDNLFETIEARKTDSGTILEQLTNQSTTLAEPHDAQEKKPAYPNGIPGTEIPTSDDGTADFIRNRKPITYRVLKALEGIGGVRVYYPRTARQYSEMVSRLKGQGLTSQSSWGVFSPANRVIVINPNGPDLKQTLFHEAAHPIVAALMHSRPDLFTKFYEQVLKEEGGKYAKFAEKYKDRSPEQQAQEAIVEFLADVAAGKVPVRTTKDSLWQRFKAWVQEVLAAMGWDMRRVDLGNPKDVRDLAARLSKAFNEGIRVSGLDGSNVDTVLKDGASLSEQRSGIPAVAKALVDRGITDLAAIEQELTRRGRPDLVREVQEEVAAQMRGQGSAEGDGGKKKRKLTKRLVAGQEVDVELKGAITDDAIYYDQLPHRVSKDQAQQVLAHMTDREAEEAVLDMKNGMHMATRFIMGIELLRNLNKEKKYDQASAFYDRFVPMTTEVGQGISALRELGGALGKAGLVEKAKRDMKKTLWRDLTEAERKEIDRLAERVDKAPEGRPKFDAMEDLLKYQAKIAGARWWEVHMAIWYANILSGPTTHIKNFVANSANFLSLMTSAMARNPRSVPFLVRGLVHGLKVGVLEAGATWNTGYSPIRGKVEVPAVLEWYTFKGGKVNPANYLKYVRRAMVAADVFSFEGLKTMRAYQLALKEAASASTPKVPGESNINRALNILNRTDDAFAKAKKQADNEYNEQVKEDGSKAGRRKAKRDRARRIYELMEAERPEQLMDDAHSYAARGTYNYKPEGLLGFAAQAVNTMAQEMPGIRLIVPFTNIIANITNDALNYTPAGLLRAGLNRQTFGKYGTEPLSEQERADLLGKAVMGTGLMVAAYMLSAPPDDDEDGEPFMQITANGTGDYRKNYELRETGWQPYSIRVGGKWYSYQYTPFMLGLAYIGNLRDFEKYRNGKLTDTNLSKFTVSGTWAMRTILDQTFIAGLSIFLSLLTDPRKDDKSEDFAKAVGNMMRGFVVPNLYTQGMQELQEMRQEPMKETASDWYGRFIRDIPVLKDKYEDKVNALGDPVIRNNTVFVNKVKDDEIWELIVDKRAFIGVPGRKTLTIHDPNNDMKERLLTDKEYHDFIVMRGKLLKAAIRKNMDVMRLSTPESVQKQMKTWKATASKDAKQILFNQLLDAKYPDKRP